jgi:outer membrane protein
MRKLYALLATLLVAAPLLSFSQTTPPAGSGSPNADVWTLQRCVDYALAHNLSIQQSVLEQRLARLTLQQSRLSQLPNVNGNASYGQSYGRTIDPTTNEFVQGSYRFSSLNANADVLLFGWFQKRNAIASNRLVAQAAAASRSQLESDISLNVATGFLRALLAWEQMLINKKQVELSKRRSRQTARPTSPLFRP